MRPARILFALTLAFAPSVATSTDAMPSSWLEFKNSKNPADIKIVASILAEEKKDATAITLCTELSKKKTTRRSVAIRQRLIAKRHLNDSDLEGIDSGRPTIGMTLCGIVATLGKPSRAHSTERATGADLQLVYSARNMYVYASIGINHPDGIVTAIQR